VPALYFQDTPRGSLKDVTLQADEFVPAIGEAWETFQSKKTEESVYVFGLIINILVYVT